MTGLVAVSKNNIIGHQGKLPWKCKEDLEWFKMCTKNKKIIVGYTTYVNMPRLRDRKLFVLSDKHKESVYDPFKDFAMSTICYDDVFKLKDYNDLIVCGGNKTYNTFINHIDVLFVTRLNFEVEGDTELQIDFEQHFIEPYLYRILSEDASVYVYINKNC